jgi:hypothetical protein
MKASLSKASIEEKISIFGSDKKCRYPRILSRRRGEPKLASRSDWQSKKALSSLTSTNGGSLSTFKREEYTGNPFGAGRELGGKEIQTTQSWTDMTFSM